MEGSQGGIMVIEERERFTANRNRTDHQFVQIINAKLATAG